MQSGSRSQEVLGDAHECKGFMKGPYYILLLILVTNVAYSHESCYHFRDLVENLVS